MLYRAVISMLRNEKKESSFDEWVVDCGVDVITRIMAFNMFCEVQFENIPAEAIASDLMTIEEHLRALKSTQGGVNENQAMGRSH